MFNRRGCQSHAQRDAEFTVGVTRDRTYLNSLSSQVLGAAMKVHTALGPGLLENAYEEVLFYELSKSNLKVERQKALPLVYEEVKMACGYRADIVIENALIIEVKSVDALNDIHFAQLMTYLRLNKNSLGLLLNFNVRSMKDGIKRIVNDF